jgi:predicted ATP-grasp superfamily ATP-dependent carboligase
LSAETVLIAAYSGRALAASARRAGYEPLVVDAFGDSDTRQTAASYRELPVAPKGGFRARPLLAALSDLAAGARRKPVGLILGSGFEDTPNLISTLSRHYRLLGNTAETVKRAKDPAALPRLLASLDIAHPETSITPPGDPTGWLSKRIGGSGGRHIRAARIGERPNRHRYFQRRLAGDQISLSGVATASKLDLRPTRQWCVANTARPFRYGGAITHPEVETATLARMSEAARRVTEALELRGLISFDFRVADGVPYLLDINPRPGATLDVLDTLDGALFRGHIAAFTDAATPPASTPTENGVRAAAILYADRGPLTAAAVDWPEWTADRPQPGTPVPRGRPIATVLARGTTPDDAGRCISLRLEELSELLYAHALGKEYEDDTFEGPRAQRLRAHRQACR